MILKLNGCTRIVLLVGKFAIKIPNFSYCHRHFLQGCLANWKEREYSKLFPDCPKVNKALFCSWFGLVSIQKRVEVLERHLTKEEVEYFKDVCPTDIKNDNFGILKGKVVCIDYP